MSATDLRRIDEIAMGWRGQYHRDEQQDREWRALPFRDRYDWRTLAFVAAIAIAALVFEAWAWGWFGW